MTAAQAREERPQAERNDGSEDAEGVDHARPGKWVACGWCGTLVAIPGRGCVPKRCGEAPQGVPVAEARRRLARSTSKELRSSWWKRPDAKD